MIYLDRIYRIIQDNFSFHHFPEESDETKSRFRAGNVRAYLTSQIIVYFKVQILVKGDFLFAEGD